MLKGFGPARVSLLNKLGIFTLEDLIKYYPRGYEDRSIPKKIEELVDGEEALIEVFPVSRMSEVRIRRNMTIYKLVVRDDTGTCTLTWYNQPYLKSMFKQGERYKFFGKVSKKYRTVDMLSPVYDKEGNSKNTGKIIPIYPSTFNLPQTTLRRIIENGLKEVDGRLEESLPDYLIKKYRLYDINTAISQIHFPESFDTFNLARNRLVFEELLGMQLALLLLKNQYTNEVHGIEFDKNAKMSDIINSLPFSLTKAQLRVLEEIDNDMEGPKPMNRLLQGDVGSRKDYCFYYISI